jgi:hypothetical protein
VNEEGIGPVISREANNNGVDLDYLLSFFPNTPEVTPFPREIMTVRTGGQVAVRSREELIYELERAQYTDCFIRTHTHEEAKKGILYLLFIDIDMEGRLEEAKKAAMETAAKMEEVFGAKVHIQFSGNKGYHVLLPLGTEDGRIYQLQSQVEAKATLAALQDFFSGGKVDRQIRGDLVRLFRIPGTVNSKGLDNEYKGRVVTVQRWDGRRADLEKAMAIIRQRVPSVQEGRDADAGRKAPAGGRYAVLGEGILQLMAYGAEFGWLSHDARLMVLFAMINAGWEDEEILSFFRKMRDYEEEKTRYFIQHARRTGYLPYSQAKVAEAVCQLTGISTPNPSPEIENQQPREREKTKPWFRRRFHSGEGRRGKQVRVWKKRRVT